MSDDDAKRLIRSSGITPERWREIGGILDTALELSPERRAEYVASACPDATLRAEVERMLDACERSGQFLAAPAGELAAPLLSLNRGHDRANVLLQLRDALAARYQIERDLGHGGSAIVYLARDVRHGRQVAVKVLRTELCAVLGAERFLREIEILSRLTHPHILPLLDSGEAGGLLYYVMPFVEGESLRRRLDREGALSVNDAVRIVREVAGALDYAHRHNVLHRDLKPENILLADGHAVVADFGIARAITQKSGSEEPIVATELRTATGVLLGTPAYMSPEQASGDRAVDGRSDIYALGCMLFEMLAGKAPFTGLTTESIVRQHLHSAPSDIMLFRADVPSRVATAVRRSLAKLPAERFSRMADFASALGESPGEGNTIVVPGETPLSARMRSLIRSVFQLVLRIAGPLGAERRDALVRARSQK